MYCFLCLEAKAKGCEQNVIKITALEKKIIELHFWLRSDDRAADFVCKKCWKTLNCFHDLYLRVQAAHKAFDLAKVSSVEEKSDAQEGYRLEQSSDLAVKKKRGRPRKEKYAEIATNVEDIQLCPSDGPDLHGMKLVYDDLDIKLETAGDVEFLEDAKKELITEMHIEQLPERSSSNSSQDMLESDSNNFDRLNANDAYYDAADYSEQEAEPNVELSNSKKADKSTASKRKALDKSQAAEQSRKYKVSHELDEYLAKNFKLTCSLCQKTMQNFNLLKSHFRVEHQQRGYASCCGLKFNKKGILVDHIQWHKNPNAFSCEQCNKSFKSKRCLEMHISRHVETRERRYICGVCNKGFFRDFIYQRHLQLHQEKIVPCQECDKKFVSKYLMNQHMRLVHQSQNICEQCGKIFKGKQALQRHIDEHAGIVRDPIPCELCGYKLVNKYALTRHMKVMHTLESLKPVACHICDKISPNVYANKRHMDYMHNMERKHKCSLCPKAFRRATELKEHMTTHTGEVLYTCPHCPKTFNSNANMHAHRKKAHRKEWEQTRQDKFSKAIVAEKCS